MFCDTQLCDIFKIIYLSDIIKATFMLSSNSALIQQNIYIKCQYFLLHNGKYRLFSVTIFICQWRLSYWN